MSTLRIELFGKFSVQRDDQLVKGLASHKEQELLSYLLVRRGRSHPRETLATALWGDTSTAKSKKYLRQALWHVQAALDGGRSKGAHFLLVEHNWVQVNMTSELWLDVDVFEHAFISTQEITGNKLDAEHAQLLKNAVELYKGDLLDGCYQDWCLFERERLQNMYLSMLDKLMSYSETHSEYETGLRYGSIILGYDRARERTYRQLMQLRHRSGDRTGALRQYERCVAALDEELGVEPDRSTKALHEYIRNDGRVEREPDNFQSASFPAGLPEVLGNLKRLHLVLAAVQKRIQRDVKAVEQTLKTLKQ